jgi:hypothetical protein
MQLAKSVIDVGLSTNNLEPMLQFWQQDVAVRFDHVLPVRRGQKQYRHDEQGSVIKLNHHAEPLPGKNITSNMPRCLSQTWSPGQQY